MKAPSRARVLAQILRQKDPSSPYPPVVAAVNRVDGMRRDVELLPEVVRLVKAREVNKTIADQLHVAVIVVKRVRALAVRCGKLPRQKRGGRR